MMTFIKELINFSKKGMKFYKVPFSKKKRDFVEEISNLDSTFYCGIVLHIDNVLRFGWNYISRLNADLYRKNFLSIFFLPLSSELIDMKILSSLLDFGFSAFVVEPKIVRNIHFTRMMRDEDLGIIMLCYYNKKMIVSKDKRAFKLVDGLLLERPSNKILDEFLSTNKPILANLIEINSYSIIYKD